MLRTLNSFVFYTSLVLMLASCWQRNQFPDAMPLDPGILAPPGQWQVDEPVFNVNNNGIEYTIEPLYRYDLKGMVVSYEHHDGNYSLHRLWNDHLNLADVCIVWGDNVHGPDLNVFDFWNGEFTCNYKTRDAAAWERFREDQISNNHLLADNPRVRKAIARVRVGDQVHIRGWLAGYSNARGFSRGTSTTRDDRGNGACETLYVKQFTILRTMQNGWRTLLNVSLVGVVASALFWLIAVMRGVF